MALEEMLVMMLPFQSTGSRPAAVSREELKELLHYNRLTGEFTWRVQPNGRVLIGSRAGSTNGSGRRVIAINGRNYYAHRLAWLYVKGDWPIGEIDHKNCNPLDNRIGNLRIATRLQNAWNKVQAHDNSTSGLLGVSWKKSHSKWCAQIKVRGVVKHLGLFSDPQTAHEAYLSAKRRMHV
jgi:HNH endonuclease